MTKKDDETMGICCCLVIVLVIIGFIIVYWYISLPIGLVGYGIYLWLKKPLSSKKMRKNQEKFATMRENKREAMRKLYENKHYEFGERLHPDEWYEEKCPNCQMNLVYPSHSEYCGWVKKKRRKKAIYFF